MQRRELSSDAKLLYSQMVLMNGGNDELHLSFDLIAEELGLSRYVVKSAYEELERYALVETTTTAFGDKSCNFVYSDMLYGSQKVARSTNKISRTLSGLR